MSEPFLESNIREFIGWARKTQWTKLTQADELRIRSKADLSATLQKAYGWTPRDADIKIDKATLGWSRK